MASGCSPAASGWTAELILAFWDDLDNKSAFCTLLKHILNNNVGNDGRQLLTSSILISVDKSSGGQRPIAMGELLFKLAGLYLLSTHKAQVNEVFKGTDGKAQVQLTIGASGGPEIAIHTITAALFAQQKRCPGDTLSAIFER